MTGPLDHTSPLPSEISVIDFATAATKTTGPSLVDPSYGSPPDSPTDSTSRKADSDVDAETGNATSGQDTAGAAGTTVQPDSVVLTERAEEKTQEGTKKGTRICVVCNANPGKYKCPRCFEP